MGKKLAIQGHPTRGKEVIELLKMMGGTNPFSNNGEVIGNKETNCYYISENATTKHISWDYIGPEEIDNYKIVTIEEFLEKYPFKVGDKVVYTKFGDNCNDYPIIIKSMKWTGTTIEYAFDGYMTCLAKNLKMWNGEPDAVISGISLNSCDYADEVELNLGDYEIEVRDGRTYAVNKKPKYPTTYVECKEMLPENVYYGYSSFMTLQKLIICRDVYWKIYGEQMGLGKPWEPDWSTSEPKYVLACTCNGIEKQWETTYCKTFAFPTAEMRDVFYENFKDLIEQCKELL